MGLYRSFEGHREPVHSSRHIKDAIPCTLVYPASRWFNHLFVKHNRAIPLQPRHVQPISCRITNRYQSYPAHSSYWPAHNSSVSWPLEKYLTEQCCFETDRNDAKAP